VRSLLEEAKKVLDMNWLGNFTVPSANLYPFQWNWDSGFVSIGLGHFEIQKAMDELSSLFSGQWANGMIPHIIFHNEDRTTYFPNHEFWKTSVNSGAPQKPKTSGITQPPVHGFILEQLLERYPDNPELLRFSKMLFPKIVDYHRFLYQYRDPFNEGLIFIYHPWESGRDNSPLWDHALNKITIKEGQIPFYERKDTQIADPSERPTSFQYDRYVYLLELGKKHHYDGKGIAEESPFLIQDSQMNAVLIRSIGYDTGEILEWQNQSLKNYDQKLWNEELGMYTGYDLRENKQLPHREIGGLVALFAGIASKHKASRMNNYLSDLHTRGFYLCPSFDVDSPLFDSKRYWRGPIWPQMNWMLYHGLNKYGYKNTADIVKNDLIELVSKLGFYEYFESQKHQAIKLSNGYGGNNFSWTAACITDLIKEK